MENGEFAYVTHFGGSPLSGSIYGFRTKKSAIGLNNKKFVRHNSLSEYWQTRQEYKADGEVDKDVRALVAFAIGLQYNEDRDDKKCGARKQILEQEQLPPARRLRGGIERKRLLVFLYVRAANARTCARNRENRA
ncbi:MAG: hypothetical protein LBR51_04425 [Bacteroidales bacterium]|nr:hypothetical protein [Bacteroidales bacterium]